MSINIMQRIWWREDLTSNEKWVGVALADNANDQGVCWPSIATLVRKTSLSRATVQRVISSFEKKQLLRKVMRQDSSSLYIFNLENLPFIETPRGEKERMLPGMDPASHRGGHPPHGEAPPPHCEAPPASLCDPEPSQEPSIEPSLFSGDLEIAPSGPTEDEIVDEVTGKWNELAKLHPGMAACRLPLDGARRSSLLRRSKQLDEDNPTVAHLWSQFFAQIDGSRFLQGRAPPGKDRSSPFKLTMTWALKSANFNEIMEGKYGDGDNRFGSAATANGRTVGPGEAATRLTLEARRASRQRRGQG